MQALKFGYVDKFFCTGSECKNTCCKHWNIFLFENEYEFYKSCKCSHELRKKLDGGITLTGLTASTKYARIVFDQNGYCPMLDENGLCSIQKELGESAISLTCTIYPRQYTKVGDEAVAMTCVSGCPAVNELLMKETGGLELIEDEYDGNNRFINAGAFTQVVSKEWKAYPYYWDMITAMINILQDRSFTLSQRLFILGFYSNKADEYLEHSPEKLPSLTASMADRSLCESLAQKMNESVNERQAAGINVLLLSRIKQEYEKIQPFSAELFSKTTTALSLKTEGDEIECDNNSYKSIIEKYRAIEDEKAYFIENLLVNELFHLDLSQGVWGSFVELLMFYCVSRLLLPTLVPEDYKDEDIALAASVASRLLCVGNVSQNVGKAYITKLSDAFLALK